MIGGYGVFGSGAYIEKTFDLSDAPLHGMVRVEVTFVVIDSWDGGESAQVLVDGNLVTSWERLGGGSNQCGGGWGDYGPVELAAVVVTSAVNLPVRITSTVNQGASDESWGVQSVRILVADAPPPPPAVPPSLPTFWQTIAHQDIQAARFHNSARTSFAAGMSADDDAYMALPADHESFRRDGVYTFRLTYGGGTMLAAGNPDWLTSTWTQTNWVTEGSPGTLTCLDAGCTKWNAAGGCTKFKGLAKSDSGSAVLDGNGLEGCWYNVVGSIGERNRGMPVAHGWVADIMTLDLLRTSVPPPSPPTPPLPPLAPPPPQCMQEIGPGHCQTGYYAGWDASIATEKLCKAQCLAEDECMFASLKVGHTCSRYDSNAGSCDPLIGTDHTTWAKQACTIGRRAQESGPRSWSDEHRLRVEVTTTTMAVYLDGISKGYVDLYPAGNANRNPPRRAHPSSAPLPSPHCPHRAHGAPCPLGA